MSEKSDRHTLTEWSKEIQREKKERKYPNFLVALCC